MLGVCLFAHADPARHRSSEDDRSAGRPEIIDSIDDNDLAGAQQSSVEPNEENSPWGFIKWDPWAKKCLNNPNIQDGSRAVYRPPYLPGRPVEVIKKDRHFIVKLSLKFNFKGYREDKIPDAMDSLEQEKKRFAKFFARFGIELQLSIARTRSNAKDVITLWAPKMNRANNSSNWGYNRSNGTPWKAHLHELGHALGLKDGYYGPRREPVNSIMRTPWSPSARLFTNHLKKILGRVCSS
jgi:hypothetical protein